MPKGQPNLVVGATYAIGTAAVLATQAPLSLLAAQRLSVPLYICVTEAVLLLCVPFMIRTPQSRKQFRSLVSSASNLGKFAILLLIGLAGILLYVLGLGRGNPIVISAVLNLDPFWAAIVAYLIAGKQIPTSLLSFALCLVVAVAGAMLLAMSQTNAHSISLQMFNSDAILAAAVALPVPVLWALSGTFMSKWFSNFDEYACVAVTFAMAGAVVIPVALAIAYLQSGLHVENGALPAIGLLVIGTILSAAVGRVLYQRSLTITDNNNGFVSMFFLLIPAFTCVLSLAMSPWIEQLKFSVGPFFFVGLLLIAAAILGFSWRSRGEPDHRRVSSPHE